MRRLPRVVALLALGAAMVLAPVAAATAQDLDDFDIASFDAQWTLTRDADGHAHLHVVETIVAVFPDFDQNRGFYRDIPEYRHGVQLHTAVESVVDEFGQPVPYTTEYYYDFFSVGLGDDSFVHGEQTYVISYDQVDVVEAFADTGVDEFYWDVNGTGWAQPFGRTSMTLTVDPSLVSGAHRGDELRHVRRLRRAAHRDDARRRLRRVHGGGGRPVAERVAHGVDRVHGGHLRAGRDRHPARR